MGCTASCRMDCRAQLPLCRCWLLTLLTLSVVPCCGRRVVTTTEWRPVCAEDRGQSPHQHQPRIHVTTSQQQPVHDCMTA